MGLFDNQFGAALAIGAFIVGLYFLVSARNTNNNGTQQGQAGGAAAGGGQQQQQTAQNFTPFNPAMAAAQQQLNAATAAHRPPERIILPSKSDDLASLVAAFKHNKWPIILHTKSRFETVPLNTLRAITRNYSNLLLVHQLASDKDEASDLAQIKQNVDATAFPRHRLILCTTDKGPESISRQHEPALLISENRTLCNFMSAFVTFAVHIDPFSTGDGIRAVSVAPAPVSPGLAPANRPSLAGGAAATNNRVYVVSNVSAILPVPAAASDSMQSQPSLD